MKKRVGLTVQACLIGAFLLACSSGDGARAQTCAAAEEWRASAQEWLYVANDQEMSWEVWRSNVIAAFRPLGNVTLPLDSADAESDLLPLMRRWRLEVEEWMSLMSRQDAEAARLRMNATIQDASGLLQTECELAPLSLYQSRPPNS